MRSARQNEFSSELIFKKSDLPLTMHYMGGKSRIVGSIIDSIRGDFPAAVTFIDLFSGSGVVAYNALISGFEVVANDIQPYSAKLLASLLNPAPEGIDGCIAALEEVSTSLLFTEKRQEYLKDYFQEQSFINSCESGSFDWNEYRVFCEKTELMSGTAKDAELLKYQKPWTLFLSYYRNTYFGVKQCAELDFIKEYCSSLSSELSQLLDACVISAMTDCTSSTAHLAQYLKPNSLKSAENLIKKRSKSIIKATIKRLKATKDTAITRGASVLNLDFVDALKSLSAQEHLVIYADPPYFKEHYSRYYHVLDTYVLYDYPALTINKVTGETTSGRYREGRIVSPFGKRSEAKQAFEMLLKMCIEINAKLAISYACSSIVEMQFFQYLSDKYQISLLIDEFELVHTGQGQSRHKKVTEYLFKFDI